MSSQEDIMHKLKTAVRHWLLIGSGRLLLVVGLLLLVLSIAAAFALADGPLDPSAEGVSMPVMPQSPPGSLADEPGPISSEEVSGSAVVNSYLRVMGTALRPINSSTTFSYDIAGCVEGSGSAFNFPLLLPEDSVIKYLRFYYRNQVTGSTHTGSGYIQTYDGTGGTSTILSVSSRSAATIGSTGYNSDLSAVSSHTVNNVSNAYVLIWVPGGLDQSLCGFRVNYDAPILSAAFLPVLLKP
jgi:hypothetical protein